MTEKPPASHEIGSILAQLQTFIDDAFEFGFKKLKTFGKKRPPMKNPETFKDQATEFAHKSAGFIGDVGSSYYETYQKLNTKKEKKKSRK
jgi:hypothetical protein